MVILRAYYGLINSKFVQVPLKDFALFLHTMIEFVTLMCIYFYVKLLLFYPYSIRAPNTLSFSIVVTTLSAFMILKYSCHHHDHGHTIKTKDGSESLSN